MLENSSFKQIQTMIQNSLKIKIKLNNKPLIMNKNNCFPIEVLSKKEINTIEFNFPEITIETHGLGTDLYISKESKQIIKENYEFKIKKGYIIPVGKGQGW